MSSWDPIRRVKKKPPVSSTNDFFLLQNECFSSPFFFLLIDEGVERWVVVETREGCNNALIHGDFSSPFSSSFPGKERGEKRAGEEKIFASPSVRREEEVEGKEGRLAMIYGREISWQELFIGLFCSSTWVPLSLSCPFSRAGVGGREICKLVEGRRKGVMRSEKERRE